MKYIQHTYLILFSLFIGTVSAQDKVIKKVTKKDYDYLAYVKTSEALLNQTNG